MAHAVADADIGAEHVHTLQERLIECRQLRVLEATLPVISHQLIVGAHGVKPVGVHLMGMHREEGLELADGGAEVARLQMVEYLFQTLMGLHILFL